MLDKFKVKASIQLLVVSVLFILGLLVRLYHLGGPSLCDDEITTAARIDHSLFDTICLLRHSEFPPFHYILLNLWTNAFGSGEWVLRFPSAIFSSLTVLVIYKLGKELFNKDIGLISAALLAFSPFAINYAQNAKMYGLFWFLAALSFLFFFRFLKGQKKNAYLFYIITSLLSCYTMYSGFLLLTAQNIIFLLMGKREERKKWFVGQFIIGLLCIPWIIWCACSEHIDFSFRTSSATYDYLTFFARAFMWIISGDIPGFGKVTCFLYIFLITFLVIDILTSSDKNRKYYPLLIWIIIPVILFFILDYFFFQVILSVRHIGFIQIPLILLVSAQIYNWSGFMNKAGAMLLIVIAISSTYVYFEYDLRRPQQDWRATAGELTQSLGRKDIILSFVSISEFEYYYKGDKSRFLMISKKDCSSESLEKKGILTRDVDSIFVLYKDLVPPDIKLDGFIFDYETVHGEIGFLHFRRTQLTNPAVMHSLSLPGVDI